MERAQFPASSAQVSALFDTYTQGAVLLDRCTDAAQRRDAVCVVLACFLRLVYSALADPDTPPADRPHLVCSTPFHPFFANHTPFTFCLMYTA